MAIRQEPITTEKEFLIATEAAIKNGTTTFVQYRDVNTNTYDPEVVLAENYVWYLNNPNDIWKDFEDKNVRAWTQFPNREERDMPWENKVRRMEKE